MNDLTNNDDPLFSPNHAIYIGRLRERVKFLEGKREQILVSYKRLRRHRDQLLVENLSMREQRDKLRSDLQSEQSEMHQWFERRMPYGLVAQGGMTMTEKANMVYDRVSDMLEAEREKNAKLRKAVEAANEHFKGSADTGEFLEKRLAALTACGEALR